MSQPEENIYQSIKSSEYFRKALDWYNIVYVYPVVQRTLFISISIVCLLCIITAAFAFYSFLPVTRPISIAIGIEDLSEEFSQIKKLDNEEDANLAIMKYILNQYVIARESYNFNEITKNLNFIKAYSAPDELTKFSNSMNIRNPDSRILRYKQNALVTVSVNSINLVPKGDAEKNTNPDQKTAEVNFTQNEVTFSGKKTAKMKAVIDFKYKDINYDKKTKAFLPLDLSVQNYKVSEIPENSKKQ